MQEHAVLLRAYARVQERCSRLLVEQAARVERLEAQIVRLRGALVARDSALAIVREELAARAAVGGALPKRLSTLLSPGSRRHLITPAPQAPHAAQAAQAAQVPQVPSDLREKAVLCVGQEEEAEEPSLARQLVEIAGGRYLHHDARRRPIRRWPRSRPVRRRRRAARSSARCRWFRSRARPAAAAVARALPSRRCRAAPAGPSAAARACRAPSAASSRAKLRPPSSFSTAASRLRPSARPCSAPQRAHHVVQRGVAFGRSVRSKHSATSAPLV
jgi:hypothetical protein